MKILHYSLGFPPYRTGGMTKYCMDLMLLQKRNKHEVALLWPGTILPFLPKTKIRRKKQVMGIGSYEIINPLPVPLDEGVTKPERFIKSVKAEVFRRFLLQYSPDVIHLHTLMGLPVEFADAAKELGIRTVFTTHDYFGLCPKVTFFCEGAECQEDHGCRKCVLCNGCGLSLSKIYLIQSPPYRILKNFALVKKLRKRHRSQFFETAEKENISNRHVSADEIKEYQAFRNYYISFLKKIDRIHYNSHVTKEKYERYVKLPESKVISITHGDIRDNRRKKQFTGKLKILYLSPLKLFKGYHLLLDALDELWQEGVQDFELHICTENLSEKPYIRTFAPYQYTQLPEIFDRAHVLAAPSIWKETFGFTVLEALSFGVPVIVSENVGAKDLLGDHKMGFIVEPKKESLKQLVAELIDNRRLLEEANDAIVNSDMKAWGKSGDIETLYKQ